MTGLLRLFLLLLIPLLAGCAVNPNSQAVVNSLKPLFTSSVPPQPLNPNFKYLRVTYDNQVALMVLGYLEQRPNGEVAVWYGNQGEMLELQQGMVVATAGLKEDWLATSFDALPDWNKVSAEQTLTRTHDEKLHHAYGIKDRLSVKLLSSAPASQLLGNPGAIKWVEIASTPLTANSALLQPAHFAIINQGNQWLPIYGEQCLAPGHCLTWQHWSAN